MLSLIRQYSGCLGSLLFLSGGLRALIAAIIFQHVLNLPTATCPEPTIMMPVFCRECGVGGAAVRQANLLCRKEEGHHKQRWAFRVAWVEGTLLP